MCSSDLSGDQNIVPKRAYNKKQDRLSGVGGETDVAVAGVGGETDVAVAGCDDAGVVSGDQNIVPKRAYNKKQDRLSGVGGETGVAVAGVVDEKQKTERPSAAKKDITAGGGGIKGRVDGGDWTLIERELNGALIAASKRERMREDKIDLVTCNWYGKYHNWMIIYPLACFPPTYTSVTVGQLAVINSNGKYIWGKRQYDSEKEWKEQTDDWHILFGKTPNETLAAKTAHKAKYSKDCWDRLPKIVFGDGKDFAMFKMDPYGNVIAEVMSFYA